MEHQNEFNLKKFQSETLEQFLAQKASYGLKGFYETDDKEFENKIEEEIEENRKKLGFIENQLLNGFQYGFVSFINFLGKKADKNLKKKEFVNAVKKANEILENKKCFKFIEKQMQKHIYDDLYQELFQVKIVKSITGLVEKPNFAISPDAKTFGYLALLVYSRNTDSINKDDLAEFQGEVYRTFSSFKTQKQDAERYKRTGFHSEKHAKQYKQKSFVGKFFYKTIFYLSTNFGEFIRRRSNKFEPIDKVEEILENSKIKKLLCSKFNNEFSEDFFEEELETETVRIVTQTLLRKHLHANFEIEKDVRLFKLIVEVILDEKVVNFCSASD